MSHTHPPITSHFTAADLHSPAVSGYAALDLGMRNLITMWNSKTGLIQYGSVIKFLNESARLYEDAACILTKRKLLGKDVETERIALESFIANCRKRIANLYSICFMQLPLEHVDVLFIESRRDLENLVYDPHNSIRNLLWDAPSLFSLTQRFAIEYGITLVEVSAERTSSTCPLCNHWEATNRNVSTNTFICNMCGHCAPPDEVAAHNIMLRGLRSITRPQINTTSGEE